MQRIFLKKAFKTHACQYKMEGGGDVSKGTVLAKWLGYGREGLLLTWLP